MSERQPVSDAQIAHYESEAARYLKLAETLKDPVMQDVALKWSAYCQKLANDAKAAGESAVESEKEQGN